VEEEAAFPTQDSLGSLQIPEETAYTLRHEERRIRGPSPSSKIVDLEEQSIKQPSAQSRSSISNPKPTETVEDTIRRLILPELTVLKR
jgi:hypothetical protein